MGAGLVVYFNPADKLTQEEEERLVTPSSHLYGYVDLCTTHYMQRKKNGLSLACPRRPIRSGNGTLIRALCCVIVC